MLKRGIFLFFSVLFLSSCNYFNFEKKDRHAIANKRVKKLKQAQLQSYPEINDCEVEDSKVCFESQLSEHVNAYFFDELAVEKKTKKDTLWLHLQVTKEGNLLFTPSKDFKKLKNAAVIEEKLRLAFDDISPIKPAILQGVPVNCNFKLPLVINNQ